jgi:serine/threonine protein kinase
VIVWQLFNRKHSDTPFRGEDVSETFRCIKTGQFDMPTASDNQEIPEVALDLIKKLLCREPSQRIGASNFEELKNHPFFEGVDFSSLHSSDIEAPLLPRQKKLSRQQTQEMQFLPHKPQPI